MTNTTERDKIVKASEITEMARNGGDRPGMTSLGPVFNLLGRAENSPSFGGP